MNFMEIVQQNWYVFVIMGVVFIGSITYAIVQRKRTKTSNDDFLTKHPDAAKVFLITKALITTEAATIYTVNGETPQKFFEGRKAGVYLVPGQNSVELSYTYSRPGVMYKTVTKSTGPVKKELVVEANKSYFLNFDRKTEEFTFEEISEEEV